MLQLGQPWRITVWPATTTFTESSPRHTSSRPNCQAATITTRSGPILALPVGAPAARWFVPQHLLCCRSNFLIQEKSLSSGARTIFLICISIMLVWLPPHTVCSIQVQKRGLNCCWGPLQNAAQEDKFSCDLPPRAMVGKRRRETRSRRSGSEAKKETFRSRLPVECIAMADCKHPPESSVGPGI